MGTDSGSAWWRETPFWGLVALVCVLYFSRLTDLTVRGEESRRGRIAWEMLQTGDWLVPRVQGVPRLSRPPLQYWVIAATGALRGEVDLAAVRWPSAISTLLTVCLIYWCGRVWLSPAAAFAAGAAYASFPQVLQLGRLGETEALFTLCLSASLLVWHVGWTRGWSPWRLWLISYALAALATLAKGPQAPVYFVGGIATYLWWTGRWRSLLTAAQCVGAALASVIVLAWQVPFSLALGKEGVARVYLSEVAKRFEDTSWTTWLSHLVTFPLEILGGCLAPWSWLLVIFAWPGVRKGLGQLREPVTFWLVCILVAFPSVWIPPEARSRYFMPLFPCFALLCGAAVEMLMRQTVAATVWRVWSRGLLAACFLLPGCIAAWLLTRQGLSTNGQWLAWSSYAAIVLGLATVGLILSNRSVTAAAVVRTTATIACCLGLTSLVPVMNDQVQRANRADLAVAEIRTRFGPRELHTFGVVHHLFSFLYGEDLPHHRWPESTAAVPTDVEWFCVDAEQLRRHPLPFSWVEVARVNCDRNAGRKPECEVVIGRVSHVTALSAN